MNKSKIKGTSWETSIVNELTRLGFEARRVVLHGKEDQGDIHIEGLPVIIEAKNEKTYKLAEWIAEANTEAKNKPRMSNDDVEFSNLGVVWAHRKGRSDPLSGYVIMDGMTFSLILNYLSSALKS